MTDLGIFSAEAFAAYRIKNTSSKYDCIYLLGSTFEGCLCATSALPLQYIGDLDDWEHVRSDYVIYKEWIYT